MNNETELLVLLEKQFSEEGNDLALHAVDRIRELENFMMAEGECHISYKEFERLVTNNKLLVKTIKHAREKLELYRDHSDGSYHGGIEHTALIKMIDTSIAAAEEKSA